MAHKSNKFEHPNQMMLLVEILVNAVVPEKMKMWKVTVEDNDNDDHNSQRIIKSPAQVS